MKNFKKLSALSLAFAGLLGTMNSAQAVVSDTAFFRALPMVVVWGADATAEGTPSPNPVASDFYLLGGATGTVGSDIITGNVFPVVTGTLNAASQAPAGGLGTLISINSPAAAPAGGGVLTDNAPVGYLNAADTLTAFGIQATTNVSFNPTSTKHSFYVASNAKFDLFAQTGAVTTTADFSTLTAANVNWAMAITNSGTDGGLAFGTNAQTPATGGTGVLAATTLSAFTAATKVFGGGQRTAATSGNLAAQSVRFDVTYSMAGGYNFSMGQGSISIPVTYTVYNP